MAMGSLISWSPTSREAPSACYLAMARDASPAPASITAGTSPFWATVGDVNGDQKLDLAVTNGSAMGVLFRRWPGRLQPLLGPQRQQSQRGGDR